MKIKLSRRSWFFLLSFALLLLFLNLICANLKITIQGNRKIPLDSCGFLECVMPPKKADLKRVILLGNSVFQTTFVSRELLKQIKENQLSLELGNFSQSGTSIADYLFMYQHLREFQPDLLVVHLSPTTFGYNWPLFRTDIKKIILKKEYRPLLKIRGIRNHYNWDDFLESSLFTYLPCYRYLPIIRADMKNKLNSMFVSTLGVPMMNFFPFSTNVSENWLYNNPEDALDADTASEYEDAEEIFFALIEQLEADKQKTIFIMQENNFKQTSICSKMQQLLEKNPLFEYHDLTKFHQKKDFVDGIHPSREGSVIVASRLFSIIQNHFRRNIEK